MNKTHGIDTCPICQSSPCVCRELAASADCPICNSTDCRCQDRSIFELEEPKPLPSGPASRLEYVLSVFEQRMAHPLTYEMMSQDDRRDYLLAAIVRKLYNL
jgi:hypothetical protein